MTSALTIDAPLSPSQAIACQPLSAILRAEHCVRRQTLTRANPVDWHRQGNPHPTCRACPQGERVAAALGVALVQINRTHSRPRARVGRPPKPPEQRPPALTREQINERSRARRAARRAARQAARGTCSVPGCGAPRARVNARDDCSPLRALYAGMCARHRGNAVRGERNRARGAS